MRREIVARATALVALALSLCACTPDGAADADADTDIAATQPLPMGCGGFDPALVPSPYESMKPCLEQVRWSIRVDVAAQFSHADTAGSVDDKETFSLEASGEQLAWTWEEDGRRAGRWSMQGKGNTNRELLLHQQGTVRHQVHAEVVDIPHHDRSTTDGVVSGPTQDTYLVALGDDDHGRTCIHFKMGATARGSITMRDSSAGAPSAVVRVPSGPLLPAFRAGPDEDPDGYVLADDYAHVSACTGTAPLPAMDAMDTVHWYGLQADPQERSWSFDGSKTIEQPGMPGAIHWTVKLRVERVPRTGLPKPDA